MIDLLTILTVAVEDWLDGDSEDYTDLIAYLHLSLEGTYGRFWG